MVDKLTDEKYFESGDLVVPDIRVNPYSIEFATSCPTQVYLDEANTFTILLYKLGVPQLRVPTDYRLLFVESGEVIGETTKLLYKSLSFSTTGNKTLYVSLQKRKSGIEYGYDTIQTIEMSVSVSVRPLSYYYKGSNIRERNKDSILISSSWPHTVKKDIIDTNQYNYLNLIPNYGVYWGESDESPSWADNAIKTGLYLTRDNEYKEIRFINKYDIISYMYNINDELGISDNYTGTDHSIPAIHNQTPGYAKIEVSDQQLLVTIYDKDSQHPVEYQKNKSEFKYKFVPEMLYVAACGGGAAGVRASFTNSDNFLHTYFNSKYANTCVVGGGSGAGLLFGIKFSDSHPSFYVKAGMGGRQYSYSSLSSKLINSSYNGQDTIISTTLLGLSNYTDPDSEVIVLQGGKQFSVDSGGSCKISKSYSSPSNMINDLETPHVIYYRYGTRIQLSYTNWETIFNNSEVFSIVPFKNLPSSSSSKAEIISNLIDGKPGPIAAYGDGYGVTSRIGLNPYTSYSSGNPYYAVWYNTDIWWEQQYKDSKEYYWSLKGKNILNLYITYPAIFSDSHHPGLYFDTSVNSTDITVGGAPSLLGSGGTQASYDVSCWPGSGTEIAEIGSYYNYMTDNLVKKSEAINDPPTHKLYAEYGAGSGAVDSNMWQNENTSSGGPGGIFLYY